MSVPMHARLGHPKNRVLDSVGDGTGTIDIRVDGSVTPVYFKLNVPETSTFYIYSVRVYVQGSPVSAGGWAGGAALENGLDVGIIDKSGVFHSAIPQKKIKVNGDWSIIGASIEPLIGVATDSYSAYLRLVETYGGPRRIAPGETYAYKIQDDLTGRGDGTFVQVGYTEVKDNVFS